MVGFATRLGLARSAGLGAEVFAGVEVFGNGLTRRLILTSVPSGFLTVTILNSPSAGFPLAGGLCWVVILAGFVAWAVVVTGFVAWSAVLTGFAAWAVVLGDFVASLACSSTSIKATVTVGAFSS
jgi:hypothetical protein